MNYSFILLIFFSLVFLTENKHSHFRCGTNDLKKKPKDIKPKFEIDENDHLYKRRLNDIDKDGFKSFNIYVDKYNIKKDLERSKIRQYSDIILNALDKAAQTLQKLLRVKPLKAGFQFEDKELNECDIYYWDTTKFGNSAIKNKVDMKTLGIDLAIFSTIDNEEDESTIAAAMPLYTQSSNHQPILGIIYINGKINFTIINTQKYIESTLIHEMTHILGFTDSFFENHFNNIFSKRDKYGIKRFYIKSRKVLEVARKYFNCSSLEGVELENYGDEGTAGSHWEARILLGDYMNGVAYTEEEVISEITLALLEDMGFYKPYYYTGGLMRYGKNKGCEFVYDKCINKSHLINPSFENEFFDDIYSEYSTDASCSSGRLSRTYHILWIYTNPIPKEFQYFEKENMGGWSSADYCPVSEDYYEEGINAYYQGICSGIELGVYGSQIAYMKKDGNYTFYTNKEVSSITGEELSDQSFCFLSSLFKTNVDLVEYYSNVTRAICYKIYCSEKSLSIKINNDYVVCPRSGGKIKIDGYEGYILCPDYNLMCAGTVICNDMFDCVEKKSEVKEESYIYDYEIKTSQNIEKAETTKEDDINNYELADDGICPKYCKHCQNDRKCLKCREDYYFVGFIEENKIICKHKDILSIGYFLNAENNIYYKCMENCDKCSDFTSCEKCKEGIDYNYNKCININIQNCKESDSLGICQKCEEDYAFNGTDRNFCINKNTFTNNYYSKDEGISYFLCSESIPQCDECSYIESSSEIKCNKCKDDFFLFFKENKCLTKEEAMINGYVNDDFGIGKKHDGGDISIYKYLLLNIFISLFFVF